MTQLTVNLPDELATRLAGHERRLPEIIERGLRQLESPADDRFADLREVLERLANLPSPEEVLPLRPTPELQAHIARLLEKNRASALTPEDEQDFASIELLEHIVRIAKSRAQAMLSAG